MKQSILLVASLRRKSNFIMEVEVLKLVIKFLAGVGLFLILHAVGVWLQQFFDIYIPAVASFAINFVIVLIFNLVIAFRKPSEKATE